MNKPILRHDLDPSLLTRFTHEQIFSGIVLRHAGSTDDLEPSPLLPEQIIAGHPQPRAKVISKSRDGTSYVMLWECNAGHYRRQYVEDQSTTFILGEVFIKIDGKEHRLGIGDMAYFPAGSSCEWRIPHKVRKIAVMRKTLGRPVGVGIRAWHRLYRVVSPRPYSSVESVDKSAIPLSLADDQR